ncbi:MAG: hypothetical protein LUQ50_12510 [Methanospirillum sp.]|uniref:hypothetical protein n=1 Tax=Methanospirillum sp. TaxID=45200 RepID=UPI00236FE517|nr:hypothetical protein [Methanospirillum sp.]MDD1729880.1 hypothetical protein [Methanospirillum sp.]
MSLTVRNLNIICISCLLAAFLMVVTVCADLSAGQEKISKSAMHAPNETPGDGKDHPMGPPDGHGSQSPHEMQPPNGTPGEGGRPDFANNTELRDNMLTDLKAKGVVHLRITSSN